MKRPIPRSRLRCMAGRTFYTCKRRLQWWRDPFEVPRRLPQTRLEHEIIHHRTPLYRELKDVDRVLQDNKVINLRLAVKQFDGMLLEPGDRCSYWRTLKKPTWWRGYRKGMVLRNGSFTAGTGGGLCQLSNLLFWMVLHAPLTVLERYRHSFDVFPDSRRKQPFGSGATCVWNYRDLVFANETDNAFQLHVWLDDAFLHGTLSAREPLGYRFEIVERNHRMRPGGYAYIRENDLYRRRWVDGHCTEETHLFSNRAWMMYEPLLDKRCTMSDL